MSVNYVPQLPRDNGGQPLQEFAFPILAKQRFSEENATASSVISFSHDSQAIEIAAVGAPAVMRWVSRTDTQGSVISAEGTANFDNAIPTGTMRRFAIPVETIGASQGSMVGANRLNGLYQRIAYKSIGVGSVLLSEY